jgi:uncharacterized protein
MEIVDVDLWTEQANFTSLAPYLSRAWRAYLQLDGDTNVTVGGQRRGLPGSMFWKPGPAIAELAEAEDAKGALKSYLDRHRIVAAILNSGAAFGVNSLANPRLANEVARAANDWLRAEWLDADTRYTGSIVVSARDIPAAAAEIHRLGEDPRFVQVQIAFPPARLGERRFDPLYEAAAVHGLPVQLLAGGAYAGTNRGVTGIGHPASELEYAIETRQGCQPQLISIISAGVFDRHADLRFVVSGFGVAWLPAFLWSADVAFAKYTARSAHKAPSEQLRAHIRVTTARAELPTPAAQLGELLSLAHGDEVLVYASGEERSDQTAPSDIAVGLSQSWLDPVFRGNALSTFRLPATATA